LVCVCVSRVVWQTDGSTPLFISTEIGHVECVRALLDGGAAINQAAVGSTTWMARLRGGSTRGDVWEPACVDAFAACWVHWDGTRLRAWATHDRIHAGLQVIGSIATTGGSILVNVVVRPGMRACGFGVCPVWGGRWTGPRRCTSPARKGT
jgi:hypothetical protein